MYDRLFSEQEKYREWLLSQPPELILNHTYEYTVREDILLTFENTDLDDDQASALLRRNVSLADLYSSFSQIETGYMGILKDLVVNEANDIIREEAHLRELPIYYHSGEYAREKGELEKYREARAANIGCRDAIQEAIKEHYHDNRLDPAAVSGVADKYGFHRVLFVLANTVRQKDWDGRFPRANKEWASTQYIPEDKSGINDDRNRAFCVEAHPVLVDGYLDMAREQYLMTRPLTPKDIDAEAKRIQTFFEKTGEPNSPNGTHKKPSALDKLRQPAKPGSKPAKKETEPEL